MTFLPKCPNRTYFPGCPSSGPYLPGDEPGHVCQISGDSCNAEDGLPLCNSDCPRLERTDFVCPDCGAAGECAPLYQVEDRDGTHPERYLCLSCREGFSYCQIEQRADDMARGILSEVAA